MIQTLKYGNTNTFYVSNGSVGVLVDTDWAGMLPSFYKEIKAQNIKLENIEYLIITHYHPDHMGIAGELVELGIKLVVMDVQKDSIHFSDAIFAKDKRLNYKPVNIENAIIISCEESRDFLKKIGINGEVIHTPGHSDDSVSLILDEGMAIVGDLYPLGTVASYNDDTLNNSWNEILSHNLKTVYYGHAKESNVVGIHFVDEYELV